jgi:hypothetical protein
LKSTARDNSIDKAAFFGKSSTFLTAVETGMEKLCLPVKKNHDIFVLMNSEKENISHFQKSYPGIFPKPEEKQNTIPIAARLSPTEFYSLFPH